MTTYLTDKEGKFIPATQRPDGTWRKARRVRTGYVPQEEVPLYESKGKQFAQRRPILPPGLYEVTPSGKSSKVQKNDTSANKNKQKEQLKQQTIPGVLRLSTKTDTSIDINTTSYTSLTVRTTISPHSTTTTASTETSTNNSGSQKLKNASPIHTNNIHIRSEYGDKLSDNFMEQLCLNDSIHLETQKKIKKLRKKLREIEQIEEKIKNNTLNSPVKDQLDKVKRKKQILKELKTLEIEQQQYVNENQIKKTEQDKDDNEDECIASVKKI